MSKINPERLMLGVNEILSKSRYELEERRNSQWREVLLLQDRLNNRDLEPEQSSYLRARLSDFKKALARTEKHLKEITQ